MVRQGFILILLLLLFPLYSSRVLAHPGHIEHDGIAQLITPEDIMVDEDATESAEVEVEEVSYELAYPGMLPDNPLYFLKTFRDAVVKFLISDPLKKAEFNVLTANKRAYASLLLAEKKETDLAIETISKSNNYLHEAAVSLSEAKKKKMDINSILDNLDKSVKKHRQVFSQQIMPIIPENMTEDLERELNRLSEIEKLVNALTSN